MSTSPLLRCLVPWICLYVIRCWFWFWCPSCICCWCPRWSITSLKRGNVPLLLNTWNLQNDIVSWVFVCKCNYYELKGKVLWLSTSCFLSFCFKCYIFALLQRWRFIQIQNGCFIFLNPANMIRDGLFRLFRARYTGSRFYHSLEVKTSIRADAGRKLSHNPICSPTTYRGVCVWVCHICSWCTWDGPS